MSIPNETIQYRLERAEETYRDAQILAQSGSWNSCVNRLYYSCFYAVSGMLLKDNLSSPKHTGVRGIFNKDYVRTGIISKDQARLYNDLFERR
ncbi:MAG: HEPN domain-containing protein [Pseudanabaena sp. CAN_BIN31]|nr:HEPN domain-containing protein [Pseudanabaena sp. CAN_BIN31]